MGAYLLMLVKSLIISTKFFRYNGKFHEPEFRNEQNFTRNFPYFPTFVKRASMKRAVKMGDKDENCLHSSHQLSNYFRTKLELSQLLFYFVHPECIDDEVCIVVNEVRFSFSVAHFPSHYLLYIHLPT